MGLSNDRGEAQKKLETYQALLDIAEAIKELSAKPDFKQLSKDAYSLPEADQKRADEGRVIITELNSKIAEQKTREKDLQEEQDNIDLRVTQLQEAQGQLVADRKKVSEREEVVGKREESTDERIKQFLLKEAALNERQTKLNAATKSLEERETKLTKEQEDSRRKADEIRRLSEGL